MERRKGYYALLQYSPVPERQEFVNVGVLLCVPEMGFLRVRATDSLRRIEKLFGRQSDPGFIQDQLQALAIRLEVEKARYLEPDALETFIRLRANDLRISKTARACTAWHSDRQMAGRSRLIGAANGRSVMGRQDIVAAVLAAASGQLTGCVRPQAA